MNPPEPTYQNDGLTVHHGDNLAVMPALRPAAVDFVLTDPPYLVGFAGRWDGARRQIAGDDDPAWLAPAFAEVWRLLKPDSFCVSFYGWPHADTFLGVWKALGFRPVSHIAFVKRQWGFGRFTRSRHETAFLLAKGKPPKPARAIADVIDWQRERAAVHPNQKPVASLRPVLASLCPPAGLVLDPFMGSGSTLLAARELGLAAVGIEVDAGYCQAAIRRLAPGRVQQPNLLVPSLTPDLFPESDS